MRQLKKLFIFSLIISLLCSCAGNQFNAERKTVKINNQFYPEVIQMNENNLEEQFANKGFVEGTALKEPIKAEQLGINIWNIGNYTSFMEGDTPPTVHPNLWRMEKLNNINGLFQAYPEPAEGDENKNGLIYQIRSYDICTMSIVKGKKGWIIIDPLTSEQAAKLGWEEFKRCIDPDAKISAIIITHSHVDHYLGLSGIVNPDDILQVSQENYSNALLNKGKVLVIAPNGFYEEAISENLYLGNSMSRRANYMYGMFLPNDEFGQVGAGLGKNVGVPTGGLYKPSFEVKTDNSKIANLTIDGLSFTFQDVPGTEAPAEFHVFINDYKVLCPGENITYTMHNLLTPRGAKVRNAKAFGNAINKSLEIISSKWNGDINVIIGVHHWPTFGKENCIKMMESQRDMYYFFNDQVIRLINKGMNMEEIAEIFTLPSTLGREYYNRGHYGSLNHNVKAVFQFYTGWWDGNPANYFKYPDEEVAKRMVEDMGGEKALLKKAKKYFDKGDYRWTIELTRHLVFYNPENTQARYLQADAFEQLAYSFEAQTWRNIFLSAAFELRNIRQNIYKGGDTEFIDHVAKNLLTYTPHYIFEYYSIMLDGFKADGVDEIWNIKIGNELHEIHIKNGVFHHKQINKPSGEVVEFASVKEFAKDYAANMSAVVKGKECDSKLYGMYKYLDTFNKNWNIVEPLN